MTPLGEYSRKNGVSDSRNLVYFKFDVKNIFNGYFQCNFYRKKVLCNKIKSKRKFLLKKRGTKFNCVHMMGSGTGIPLTFQLEKKKPR